MKIIDVKESDFKEEVLESDKKILIDFNADWCGPCRMLRPILDEVSMENDNIKIVSINIDREENLARRYGVMSIPCLVLMDKGKEIKRSVGLIPKEDLETFLGE